MVVQWVAEHLTRETAAGSEADRKKANFQPDPTVPQQFSAHNKGKFLHQEANRFLFMRCICE